MTDNQQLNIEPNQSMSSSEMQRIDQARIRLLHLTAVSDVQEDLSGWTPAWSSAVLEHTVVQILSPLESRISDLFRGLWILLTQTNAPLTKTMSHFLRDIVILCFTRYRLLYERENFEWMSALLTRGCTEAQAYLALYALPNTWLTRCRETILVALGNTDFIEEARQVLYASNGETRL